LFFPNQDNLGGLHHIHAMQHNAFQAVWNSALLLPLRATKPLFRAKTRFMEALVIDTLKDYRRLIVSGVSAFGFWLHQVISQFLREKD